MEQQSHDEPSCYAAAASPPIEDASLGAAQHTTSAAYIASRRATGSALSTSSGRPPIALKGAAFLLSQKRLQTKWTIGPTAQRRYDDLVDYLVAAEEPRGREGIAAAESQTRRQLHFIVKRLELLERDESHLANGGDGRSNFSTMLQQSAAAEGELAFGSVAEAEVLNNNDSLCGGGTSPIASMFGQQRPQSSSSFFSNGNASRCGTANATRPQAAECCRAAHSLCLPLDCAAARARMGLATRPPSAAEARRQRAIDRFNQKATSEGREAIPQILLPLVPIVTPAGGATSLSAFDASSSPAAVLSDAAGASFASPPTGTVDHTALALTPPPPSITELHTTETVLLDVTRSSTFVKAFKESTSAARIAPQHAAALDVTAMLSMSRPATAASVAGEVAETSGVAMTHFSYSQQQQSTIMMGDARYDPNRSKRHTTTYGTDSFVTSLTGYSFSRPGTGNLRVGGSARRAEESFTGLGESSSSSAAAMMRSRRSRHEEAVLTSHALLEAKQLARSYQNLWQTALLVREEMLFGGSPSEGGASTSTGLAAHSKWPTLGAFEEEEEEEGVVGEMSHWGRGGGRQFARSLSVQASHASLAAISHALLCIRANALKALHRAGRAHEAPKQKRAEVVREEGSQRQSGTDSAYTRLPFSSTSHASSPSPALPRPLLKPSALLTLAVWNTVRGLRVDNGPKQLKATLMVSTQCDHHHNSCDAVGVGAHLAREPEKSGEYHKGSSSSSSSSPPLSLMQHSALERFVFCIVRVQSMWRAIRQRRAYVRERARVLLLQRVAGGYLERRLHLGARWALRNQLAEEAMLAEWADPR